MTKPIRLDHCPFCGRALEEDVEEGHPVRFGIVWHEHCAEELGKRRIPDMLALITYAIQRETVEQIRETTGDIQRFKEELRADVRSPKERLGL